MAHDHFTLTESLVRLLEHPRTFVVLHLNVDNVAEVIEQHPVLASARLIPRIDVRWGQYSLLKVQLNLLQAALEEGFDYVHLISGKDLPLRPVEDIMDFIDAHDGTEFLAINPPKRATEVRPRVGRYWSERLLEGKVMGGPRGMALRAMQKASVSLQGGVGIDRTRRWGHEIQTGEAWCSVTSALARHFVDHMEWADHHLRKTFVPEEFFWATMACDSPRREYVEREAPPYYANLRHISWQEGAPGHPHIWRMADLPELAASPNMFARKFDPSVDSEVVEEVIRMASRRESADPGGS
jgi:hypothetical protein